jgi:hypothetical protein
LHEPHTEDGSTEGEPRLALAASTCVGKTTVLRQLQKDPRLSRFLVVDVDSFRNSASPDTDTETRALRRLLKKNVDTLFGVMVDERTRTLLAKRGWSFIVLSVPESLHREKFERELAGGREPAMTLEESLDVQRRLEGLGYHTVDAARSVEAISKDLTRTIKSSSRQKFAILSSPGVGTTALVRYLRNDAQRKARVWRTRLVVDCSLFIPADVVQAEVPTESAGGNLRARRWNRAERAAALALMSKGVDVVGAVLTTHARRTLVAKEGFSIVVLSLPESIHRQRLDQRREKTGGALRPEAAIRRQRKLESLGYETIDASGSAEETADRVVDMLLAPRTTGRDSGSPRSLEGA